MEKGMPERPRIPDILIEATARAIKAGMRPDEFAKAMGQQNEDEMDGVKVVRRKGAKSKRRMKVSKSQGEEEEETEPERTYRDFGERRLSFLVIGDQQRFAAAGKKGKDQFIFPTAPPLDYSFCVISRIEEIITEAEQPQTSRNYRFPDKTPDERYQTSSIRLSYNVIDSLEGLINVMYKILDGGPFGLCWLDLSFNAITKLDSDTFSQLPNLKILYLHGNSIVHMTEIPNLQALRSMKTLTLHGNPIEKEEGYRIACLYYLPDLKHLDYIGVTKGDRANATYRGARYEPYWEKRHGEFEAKYQPQKKVAEISYTEKVMKGMKGGEGENLSDDDNDDRS